MKFNIVVNYKLVAKFEDYDAYSNHPLGAMDYYVKNSTTICLNDEGASCQPNENTPFPVSVYRLMQHSEN